MDRMIAEWEPQEGVVLAFPKASSDWSAYLQEAITCVVAIVEAIARREKVYLFCEDAAQTGGYFKDATNIVLIEADYTDTWMRDCIALGVIVGGNRVFKDYVFNGWGGKFDGTKDTQLSRLLESHRVIEAVTYDTLVLEGGALESDGAGTIMTTSTCLLNPNRNPHLSKAQIEAKLKTDLNAEQILWLDHGELEGDDTDAHIDTLARFCDANTIAYVGVPPKEDSHFATMDAMRAQLKSFKNVHGVPYKLVELPFVEPIYYDGERLPATYANFLIINGAVLVPTYGVWQDAEALELLRAVFPHHEVIGIDCQVLIREHGSLHCMTMQIPKKDALKSAGQAHV